MEVAWIHVAPVKSLAVEERRRVTLGPSGVNDDRRYCVVDAETHATVNAKRIPTLVAIRPSFAGNMLTLHMPDGSRVQGEMTLGDQIGITAFWGPAVAREVLGPWGEALSDLARRSLRLVRMESDGEGVDRGNDGPATLLSQGSLEALARIAGATDPVDPRRFRMLFGVAGATAHAEDGWIGRRVRLGEAVVVPAGHVGRCAVTTVGPDTGRADLDTLGALRRYRSAVASTEPLPFGIWARVAEPGEVAVGDAVEVEA
jgi:uncharacterized protein YcbX